MNKHLLKTQILFAAICSLLLLSMNSNAQDNTETKEIISKGNKFTLSYPGPVDTIIQLIEYNNTEVTKTVTAAHKLITMNGEHIYSINELNTPTTSLYNTSIEDYILAAIKKDNKLSSLPNATLLPRFYNMVIDKKGKIVYYEPTILYYKTNSISIASANEDTYSKDGTFMLHAPLMKPATINGKPVISLMNINLANNYNIQVKDHKITATRK